MYEVVGFERTQFQAKDNGQTISGWTFHVEFEHKNTTGYRTDHFFLSDGKCDYKPELGDKINIYFNRYGKIESVQRM